MATKRKATITITISVDPKLTQIVKKATASGLYRNASHFFESAALRQAKLDGLN